MGMSYKYPYVSLYLTQSVTLCIHGFYLLVFTLFTNQGRRDRSPKRGLAFLHKLERIGAVMLFFLSDFYQF